MRPGQEKGALKTCAFGVGTVIQRNLSAVGQGATTSWSGCHKLELPLPEPLAGWEEMGLS